MPAIENLMKRWGFVRLSRYGLILTPEGRIMSLRPVLDDGMGGPIVGWRDRDLASAELSQWEPARPASQRAVASRVATHVRVSPPVAASVIAPLIPTPIPTPAAIYVAAPAEPEEDEWEWEIALARARAVAEEVAMASIPAPVQRSSRRTRQETVPPPPKFIEVKTEPMFVSRDQAIDSGEWPKTEPLGDIDYEDHTNPVAEVVRVVRLAKPAIIPARTIHHTTPPAPLPIVPLAARSYPRGQSPQTVIPIPRLPRLDGQSVEPVVRTRFPKATPPAMQARPSQNQNIVLPPPIRAADDDKTSPGIALPPPANMIALPRIPSIKRAR
jgi:hypothetical protein